MKTIAISLIFFVCLFIIGCSQKSAGPDDFLKLARQEKQHLRLSTYITAHTVQQLFTSEDGRREALSLLRCYGITRVYFEVYRSGLVIPPEVIRESVKFLKDNGLDVTGGIATVPGEGFGLAQDGPLGWFNWQNKKTQDELRKVIEDSAPFFDSFIVDDFLCTSDTSLESKSAKGERSWSEYRRSLLTGLSQSVIINPARSKNPDIKMIIKYPQWYDRFHLFGYDVAAESKLYDGIWVGTESRGQYTQRFGFVQPYEGFINFRWLSSVAGNKCGGAWFDHEDCTDQDFIDQAYQSVLAGARELIIFSFDSFVTGNPGHHLLFQDFRKLSRLAESVASSPVSGPVGYKPPNSDAGGDLYLFDYIGMLGVSLVPGSSYPENAKVILLPTQAAADQQIYPKIMKSLDAGVKVILTTGFLASAKDGEKLAKIAGVKWPLEKMNSVLGSVTSDGSEVKLKIPVQTDFLIAPDGADILLRFSGKNNDPFLLENGRKNICVINSHTFSQADFDAVGEVLLSPRPVGLLELPESWVNIIRRAFSEGGGLSVEAPARVTVQILADGNFILQNYNQEAVKVKISLPEQTSYTDGFTGVKIQSADRVINIDMKPRSRTWYKPSK